MMIWNIFARVEVDLFASVENIHYLIFCSVLHVYLGVGALPRKCQRIRKKCFSGEDFASGHLKKIKLYWETVMLIAPKWPSCLCFPVMVELFAAVLCPI